MAGASWLVDICNSIQRYQDAETAISSHSVDWFSVFFLDRFQPKKKKLSSFILICILKVITDGFGFSYIIDRLIQLKTL